MRYIEFEDVNGNPFRIEFSTDYDCDEFLAKFQFVEQKINDGGYKIVFQCLTSRGCYPDGWFTHNCKYLVDDIKCDLGLKDGCEYTTSDQRCGLIVRRLEQAEYLQNSARRVRK